MKGQSVIRQERGTIGERHNVWRVLPRLTTIRLLLFLFAAGYLSLLAYWFGLEGLRSIDAGSGVLGAVIATITPATLIFFLTIWFVGKYLWKLFWHTPGLGTVLNRKVCPNLNGTWHGQAKSNYRGPGGDPIHKEVTLKVVADFFDIQIRSESSDRYSLGKTVEAGLYKDPRTNTFFLSYMFEGDVPMPEPSDDRKFDGAARLEIVWDGSTIRMEGTYWTNRAWQRNQNTAGHLSITRQ